jgi:hypothetical protein
MQDEPEGRLGLIIARDDLEAGSLEEALNTQTLEIMRRVIGPEQDNWLRNTRRKRWRASGKLWGRNTPTP